jgi:threonine/homoserine/homoserine lactone efflux protein
MAPVSRLLTFAALSAALIAVPGPSVLFTISRALATGWRCALFTAVGNEIGEYAQVAGVAFGIGTLVERSAEIFVIVKWAGAAYLAYLGVQAIRHRRSVGDALDTRAVPLQPFRAVRDGFIVGVTNPKSIVIFVAVLPEFADRGHGHLPVQVQMLILGGLFAAMALLLDSGWAAAAGTARQWLARSPRRLALIGGTSGLVMIGLGISVAVTGRSD